MFFSNMEIFTGGLTCSKHRTVSQLEGHESQVVVMWMNIKWISTDVEKEKLDQTECVF